MKVADLNESAVYEYVHTQQDPMLLRPIPARPKTLLHLAAAGVVIAAIVAVLALLMPEGDRTQPNVVEEDAIAFLLQEQRDNIACISAVKVTWQDERKYTHVIYETKNGQILQRVYYGSHTNGEWFDPSAQELGENQTHYDDWQAAMQKNGVTQFTPKELEELL